MLRVEGQEKNCKLKKKQQQQLQEWKVKGIWKEEEEGKGRRWRRRNNTTRQPI